MAHRLLLLAHLPPVLREKFAALGPTDQLPDGPAREAFLRARGGEYTIGVTHGTAGASAELINALPNLQAICSLGAGYDAVDMAALRARRVLLSNTPDVVNDCVADLTMGLIIDVARQVTTGDRYVRSGDWAKLGMAPLGVRVSGKRLGLIGMGRIGRVIASRAQAFQMSIRYHARHRKTDLAYEFEASLPELARWSDFLVVAVTGGEATRGLVSTAVLEALGPSGFLVNIARGPIVDEAALVAALQRHRIAGAALDVFADEPHVPKALLAMDNVVLTPHIGTATRETRGAMARLVIDNVRSFLDTGRLLTPVHD
ncbi:MAG TPA: 2-hydroxyacid dehydrogenase [Nevskiaceae bacterium]